MLATLVSLLLVAFLVFGWRSVERIVEGAHPEDTAGSRRVHQRELDRLDLARLRRDMAVAAGLATAAEFVPQSPAALPEPLAEGVDELEAALSHQLLAGALDSATYRARMTDLAHGSRRTQGGR